MSQKRRGARRRLLMLSMIVLAAAGLAALGAGPARTGRAANDVPIYEDALATGWVASSRSATVSLAATGEVYAGSRAIEVHFGGGPSALKLVADSTLLTGGAARIQFALYAPDASTSLALVAGDGSGNPVGTPYRLPVAPGSWLLLNLSLDVLGDPAAIRSLTWQKAGNKGPQPAFRLDEIALLDMEGVPLATSTPVSPPTVEPTAEPTTAPPAEPTTVPPAEPTTVLTTAPTTAPPATATAQPTIAPTVEPTATAQPTSAPTATAEPTIAPTATAEPTAAAPAPAPGASRISWNGGSWYMHGVNVPWLVWAEDFGGQWSVANEILNADGTLDTSNEVVQRFAQLPAANVHAVTWWLFSGNSGSDATGPAQILRDGSGRPTGIEPEVYRDIDAALLLAEEYDLYYTFPVLIRPNQVPLSWMTTYRADLIDALRPLFQRYSGEPRIMAWSAFVEPEWAIWNEGFPQQVAQDYVRDFAAAVHAESNQLVTLNSAMLDGLPLWQGLGLDFYSSSWYDYMNNNQDGSHGDSGGDWCALCTTVGEVQERYGLDKPLVIGEFYAGADADYLVGGQDLGPLGRLNAWYDNGYAGAYGWSLFPERTYDQMAVEWNSYGIFGAAHGDSGPR